MVVPSNKQRLRISWQNHTFCTQLFEGSTQQLSIMSFIGTNHEHAPPLIPAPQMPFGLAGLPGLGAHAAAAAALRLPGHTTTGSVLLVSNLNEEVSASTGWGTVHVILRVDCLDTILERVPGSTAWADWLAPLQTCSNFCSEGEDGAMQVYLGDGWDVIRLYFAVVYRWSSDLGILTTSQLSFICTKG